MNSCSSHLIPPPSPGHQCGHCDMDVVGWRGPNALGTMGWRWTLLHLPGGSGRPGFLCIGSRGSVGMHPAPTPWGR